MSRPKAGETRLNAPVLASADLAKITKQIQAIQAAQVGKAKHPKKETAKPPLVPVKTQPAKPRKDVTAAAPAQLGAAILAARTAAKLSQTTLASRLKPRKPALSDSRKATACRRPAPCNASPRRPATSW